jgi:hypothetical protein
VKPSDLFPRATSRYFAVAGCAAGSARPFGTHLGAGFFASTLRPWNKEAYAEARLPRNAVAWLNALSDTKIGRLDEARSTRSFHFLALIHPTSWNRYSANFAFIGFSEVRIAPVHYTVMVLWPLTLLPQMQHRASSICTKSLQGVLRGAANLCMVWS